MIVARGIPSSPSRFAAGLLDRTNDIDAHRRRKITKDFRAGQVRSRVGVPAGCLASRSKKKVMGPIEILILGVVGHAEFIQANILSPTDMLIVGIVAVMLFGNRLPGVARSLGKSLTEFKKGMQEIEDEVKTSIYSEPPNRVTLQDRGQLATARRESAQCNR